MAIQAVRGTRDILPEEIAAWHAIGGPVAAKQG